MPLDPVETSLQNQVAAHMSWANTKDRSARTAKARKALDDKFLAEADGDPQRAESLRKAYFLGLALKSAKARKARREAALPPKPTVEQRLAELERLTAGGAA